MAEVTLNDNQLCTVLDLTDQLEYQSDAIVSQTLLDGDSITITLFAVDEGQRISEHSAPHEALIQVIEGAATITVEGTDRLLTAGQSIILAPKAPHALSGAERFKMILVMAK